MNPTLTVMKMVHINFFRFFAHFYTAAACVYANKSYLTEVDTPEDSVATNKQIQNPGKYIAQCYPCITTNIYL